VDPLGSGADIVDRWRLEHWRARPSGSLARGQC
jgi:hypothetical protein